MRKFRASRGKWRQQSSFRKDLDELRSKPWIRPTGVVLAFTGPNPLNEVILAGHLRYQLTKEITHDEFMAQLRENATHTRSVAATGWVTGSKLDTGESIDAAEPGPEFTHFYAAECI
jgi:hypothetical protein